ncbi:P-loop containing nucleoside triphosphate hydrolase protein [Dissoconium aciculare CBS 342.82]|uniref:P-loop containing nucleoside triphosphate hydrolase protein n=1 Tax=Dissoconium aciculare CBS 342.82 TaxID=1314786 RepID=A0A6J3M877_9PEZI|nr:P-loop containing nucleoside triphosphate hydrolase protein [Dissoconium aciculare CBS 342.82]KAF1823047.1 P-loop containing nucleoside triphosphate hydrolase protein [Dissoconium aciculare CBS 342.82]
MVLAKSKNAVGLGNSLMNDRFGKGKNSDMHRGSAQPGAIKRRDQEGNEYITNAKQDADWVKMRSITEQGALDEFLSTAELAGTDFTAEKMNNVKIIHTDQKNPYLLSAAEERGVVKKQNAKRARLTVPRRPAWDKDTTPRELDERERQSLLDWRRGLAELQEVDDLLMTPFERNLEVWRQLWRVIERSDLVVQIVDARNPLLYRCEDLEKYVKEVDGGKKRNLLLVNKADMMTLKQRQKWAEFFNEKGIAFRFFSAELAKEMNEAREDFDDEEDGERGRQLNGEHAHAEDDDEGDEEEEDDESDEDDGQLDEDDNAAQDQAQPPSAPPVLSVEEQTRILTTEDLEALFLEHSPSTPKSKDPDAPKRKTQIGLVGYPNVGKSSTINALLGAKKVSVSATPGKTKHFQTIHLSPRVVLCDCPGLVFPNFATTKAELVCAGVLPIDQLREHTGPAALVAQRIPKPFLEALYGMKILIRPIEEGGTGSATGSEVLRAYAKARGFFTQGLGQPDESRAARYVLKDYVKGKLLFCHPPPIEPSIEPKEFNRELYDVAHLPPKRQAQIAAAAAAAGIPADDISLLSGNLDFLSLGGTSGRKGADMDKAFFAPGQGRGTVNQPFHYKYSEQGVVAAGAGGKPLSGRKLKTMTALERDIDPAEVANKNRKKHFKGNKRALKQVREKVGGVAYDD